MKAVTNVGSLVFTGSQHKALLEHLHPGDGLEAVAVVLCHCGQGQRGFRLMAKELMLIPADECPKKTEDRVLWNFGKFFPADKISKIDKSGMSIVTIHSHPSGHENFSIVDNENDKDLFHSVCNWFDDDRPNGSAIMLPDGKVVARTVDGKGRFSPIESVSVIADNIRAWKKRGKKKKLHDFGLRVLQTFGKGTFEFLRQMRVGVVGCSGTGSIIVELLARNCVGNLVIVDPDVVEEKNLNRILNAKKGNANKSVPKVEVLKDAVESMGTEVLVDAYQSDTASEEVVRALVDCDVVFGCVDSARGRYHLECIANAYLIPYFDVGVNLEADGDGGIAQADAVAHYIHPENACLLSRGAYTSEQVRAEDLRNTDKKRYEEQRMAGYLAAVGEDQPAVISINMPAACMAFNDFMARIHNFRLDDNAEFDIQRFRIVHGVYSNEAASGKPVPIFQKYLGMGDRSFLIQNLKNHGDKNS